MFYTRHNLTSVALNKEMSVLSSMKANYKIFKTLSWNFGYKTFYKDCNLIISFILFTNSFFITHIVPKQLLQQNKEGGKKKSAFHDFQSFSTGNLLFLDFHLVVWLLLTSTTNLLPSFPSAHVLQCSIFTLQQPSKVVRFEFQITDC